jgi:hypothetical protein
MYNCNSTSNTKRNSECFKHASPTYERKGKHKGNKFTWRKGGKSLYTSANSLMNFFVLDVPVMTTEPQLKRYCTIFTLDGAIKMYASLLAQHISDSLIASSVIVQTFNTAPTPSIVTVQIILHVWGILKSGIAWEGQFVATTSVC